MSLTNAEYENLIIPEIDQWFNSEPNWLNEQEFFPVNSTAYGAAFEFFQGFKTEHLKLLGVVIVEGDHPGSSYYAAELHENLEMVNLKAKKAEIPVLFQKSI